jgi:hypothetical protein
MRMKCILLFMVLTITFIASPCTSESIESLRNETNSIASENVRILFIGNSLTAKNDLPEKFLRFAIAAKKNLQVFQSLLPGATLAEHSTSSQTIGLLQARQYTHVVLQEQSYFLSLGLVEEKRHTWPAADALKTLAGNAQVVLYETFAYQNGIYGTDTYEDMQSRVCEGYENLRQHLGCETAHVGKTWARARSGLEARNLSVRMLYGDDTHHPSRKGTFLAASVIFAQVYKMSVRGLSPKLDAGVSRAFARLAQQWTDEEFQASVG